MKHLSSTLSIAAIAAALFTSPALAQVKIGTNPTVIEPASNLEAEAATAGRKVKVDKTTGQLTIKDGTEGNGKILTSDAVGGASWQDKDVSCNGFEATRASLQTITVGTNVGGVVTQFPTVVVANTEVFDAANAYNVATGEYTVPVAGTYIFTATAAAGGTAPGRRTTGLNIESSLKGNISSHNDVGTPFSQGIWTDVSAVTKAAVGEKIKVVIAVTYEGTGGTQVTIPVSSVRFSGSRIDCNKE